MPEDEIFYFKEPITMEKARLDKRFINLYFKELSPLMMSTDSSLPIDHADLENEGRPFDEKDEKTSPKVNLFVPSKICEF